MSVREPLIFLRSNARFNALETGFFAPKQTAKDMLGEGEIGYVATGLKEPREVRIGDTITSKISNQLLVTSTVEPLPGYAEPKPMVFASAYPEHADDYELLRDSLRRLNLNDAAIQFEPESSSALGRGFRIGFLGMLHLEIIGERLMREYGIAVIFTAPSVNYTVKLKNGKEQKIYSAGRFPLARDILEICEPWVKLTLLVPISRLGAVTQLLQEIRGGFAKQEFFGHKQVEIIYDAPLADIIVDFYDRLKSVTEGYGSMSYEAREERPGDLVKIEIRIAGEAQETLSAIIPKEKAAREGRRIAERLKTLLPRQLFPVAIQAAVGGDIIARETIPALRKDVTGYLYGGDRTRKMKLWKKQQRGKKRLRETGKVEIPSDVFIKMLKR